MKSFFDQTSLLTTKHLAAMCGDLCRLLIGPWSERDTARGLQADGRIREPERMCTYGATQRKCTAHERETARYPGRPRPLRLRNAGSQNVPVSTSVRLLVQELSEQFVWIKNGRKLVPIVPIAS